MALTPETGEEGDEEGGGLGEERHGGGTAAVSASGHNTQSPPLTSHTGLKSSARRVREPLELSTININNQVLQKLYVTKEIKKLK